MSASPQYKTRRIRSEDCNKEVAIFCCSNCFFFSLLVIFFVSFSVSSALHIYSFLGFLTFLTEYRLRKNCKKSMR